MALEAMTQVIGEAKASEFVERVLERDGNEVTVGSIFPTEDTPRQERPAPVIIDAPSGDRRWKTVRIHCGEKSR